MKKIVVLCGLLINLNFAFALSPFFESFEKAQNEFTQGHIEEAQKSFLQLVDLSQKLKLSQAQRKAVHYSYLRLAQLESESSERQKWFSKALHLNPQETLDQELFPPPLVNEYLLAQQERASGSSPQLNLQPTPDLTSMGTMPPAKSSPKWYKNKWVWAGITVLTTGVVLSLSQNSNKDKKNTPTSTDGF